MNDEHHDPIFTGVWIPADIWEHPELTWFQRCLWGVIFSLGRKACPCWASNEWLAEKTGAAVQTIKNDLCLLKKLDLIKDVSSDFGGEKRYLLASTDGTFDRTPKSTGRTPKSTGRTPKSTETGPPNIVLEQRENKERGNSVDRVGKFKQELAPIFKRTNTLCWDVDPLICQVVSRPDFQDEWAELLRYRTKPGNYFPQSLEKLLSHWEMQLDKARTYDESFKQRRPGLNELGPDRNKGTLNTGRADDIIAHFDRVNARRSGGSKT